MPIPKNTLALATHEGPAILHVGADMIPVKITEIESEWSPYQAAESTVKLAVLDGPVPNSKDLVNAAKKYLTAVAVKDIQRAIGQGLLPKDLFRQMINAEAERLAIHHMPCVVKAVSYEIENVGFTATSTTVHWKDGTQTCIDYQSGDPRLKEHDLALAFSLKRQGIEKVIFNDPATVVLWMDGTKTIVRCQEGDTYSAETGLALCIAKKMLDNKGNFNDVFKKHIPTD